MGERNYEFPTLEEMCEYIERANCHPQEALKCMKDLTKHTDNIAQDPDEAENFYK